MTKYIYGRRSDGRFGWVEQKPRPCPVVFHITDSRDVCHPLCPACKVGEEQASSREQESLVSSERN